MSRTSIHPSLTPNVLPLAGGTMSGNIAMGGNKVTGLASGGASGDVASVGQIATFVKNLAISWVNATQNHILWDWVSLQDPDGNLHIDNAPGTLWLIDMEVTGAKGLDTGSVAASSWYYVWIISNGTNTYGMYSLSRTAPTMPSGYTYKLLVGAVRTDASAHILRGLQVGNYFRYATDQIVVDASTYNGSSNQNCPVYYFVPPYIAWGVDVRLAHTSVYSTAGKCELEVQVVPNNWVNPLSMYVYHDNTAVVQQILFPNITVANEPLSAVDVTWSVATTSADRTSSSTSIYVQGYTLHLGTILL
jgi:hypothetical protein